jgi:putative peptidoglycan lipid II flippase
MPSLRDLLARTINAPILRQQTAAQAAVLLTLLNTISKPLGLLREMVIANRFGATAAKDAFVVSQNLPTIFGSVIASALVAAFIPTFISVREQEGEAMAWSLLSRVFTLLAVIMGAVCALMWFFASPAITFMAPGLNEEVHALATQLSRYMIPMILISTFLGLFTAVLNAYRHFLLPRLAEQLNNIFLIAAVLLLTSRLGIASLIVGSLGAAFIQLVLVGGVLLTRKPFLRLSFGWRDRHLRQVFRLMLPMVIGGSVGVLNLIIDRTVASFLPVSSISALDYASKIMAIPAGMFIGNLATALYPTLALHWARHDAQSFRASLGKGLSAIWYIILPSTAGLVFLCQPIVSVVFQTGAFTAEATVLTASVLLYYALGLFALAGAALLSNAFIILGDAATPTWLGIAALLGNINLNLFLAGPAGMGAPGLALATSIVGTLNFLALLYFLQKRIGRGVFRGLVRPVAKVIAASLLMGVGAWGLWTVLAVIFHPSSYWARLALAMVVVLAAVALYAGLSMLFKIDEFQRYRGYLERFLARLRRRRQETG